MKAWLVKLPNGDLRALESDKLKRLSVGEALEFEFKFSRNIKFHRKFFSLMNAVYGIEEIERSFLSLDHLRYVVTIEAGFSEVVTSITGKVYLRAKSISFVSMDEAEFDELYSKSLDVILSWLPRYVKNDLDAMAREVLSYG